MSNKKILTRNEFEALRIKSAKEMAASESLRNDAFDLMSRADRHMWLHQANWFGEPLLNVAQDIIAMQEVVFKSRPKYIVEVGVAWAGSLLFYSTLMEVLGGEKIIAIDIYIPDDLKQRIAQHEKLAKRVEWIDASSTDPKTLDRVREIVGDSKEVMVVLDSDHTHDHVLRELQMYHGLVGKDQYMICGDTVVEFFPNDSGRIRPWGKGNNPMTALRSFLETNKDFERDEEIENKLLFTCHPYGYLRRTR